MLLSIANTKLAYIVPAEVVDLARIWERHVVWNEAGRRYTFEEARAYHVERFRKTIRLDHENDADPAAVAYAVADTLDLKDGTYFLAVDAHERASDGRRLLARVIVRNGHDLPRRELTLPWEAGSPSLDIDTLVKAGLTPEQATSLADALDLDIEPTPARCP